MASTFEQNPADFSQDSPTRVRYLVVLAATLMAILLYLDRFCVSFAADYIREDLNLTQQQMSWFLSAFFWSYALAQVPSGWLSDRYGARIMLVLYILSWSLFTAMIGASTSFALLFLTRLGTGLGQAGAYPTSASLVSKWVPFSARGTASAMISTGGRIGGAIAPLLTALLIFVFVPPSTPVEFQAKDLRNPGRLSARLAPLTDAQQRQQEDHQAPAEKTEARAAEKARKKAAKSLKYTAPDDAARAVFNVLPDEMRTAVVGIADKYRAAEYEQFVAADGANRGAAATAPDAITISDSEMATLVAGLNAALDRTDIYNVQAFDKVSLPQEATAIVKRLASGEGTGEISSQEFRRFNRLVLEATFSGELSKLYVLGWRPVMYVYGLAGVLVAGFFWVCCRNRPEAHPWCNRAEQELIAAGRPPGAPSPHGKAGMVPIGRLLTSRSMWFCCFGQVGTNIGWVFLVTWLPRYLLDVHKVPILERGLMSSIPIFVGMVAMFFGGVLTDKLVPAVGLKWGRRLPMMLTRFSAALGYVICFCAAAYASPDSPLTSPWLFVAAFSLVAFSTDLGTASTWAFNQDVGGRYVGSILGWGNMWGNLGAAFAPPIYNYFLGESPTVTDWNQMFLVCMGAFLFAGFCGMMIDATIPIAPPDEDGEGEESAAATA